MGIWTLESWVKVSRTTCSCWLSGSIYYEVEISTLYGYFVTVWYYGMGILTLESWVKVPRATCSCWLSGSIYYEVEISTLYGYFVTVWYYGMGILTLESWVKVPRATCSCWLSGSIYYEVEISTLYGYLCLWDVMRWKSEHYKAEWRYLLSKTTCSCWISESVYYEVEISRLYGYFVPVGYESIKNYEVCDYLFLLVMTSMKFTPDHWRSSGKPMFLGSSLLLAAGSALLLPHILHTGISSLNICST